MNLSPMQLTGVSKVRIERVNEVPALRIVLTGEDGTAFWLSIWSPMIDKHVPVELVGFDALPELVEVEA